MDVLSHSAGGIALGWVIFLLCGLLAGCGEAGSVTAPSPPIANGRDRWTAYQTSVDPGSGLQFVSPHVGFSLAAQPVNVLDGRLSAGRVAQLAWPSPAMLATADGGRGWRRALAVPAGLWGIDFVDARHGWAVGVTALYRTIDGGRRWRRAAEAGAGGRGALVRVAFTGASTGFGLTTQGRVVKTDDGGASWLGGGLARRAGALCVQSHHALTVADQDGGIWHTGNGGISWSQVALDLRPVEQFTGWRVDLSCAAGNGVELAQAFCTAACGGGVISVVRETTGAGRSWRQIARPVYGSGNPSAPQLTRVVAVGGHEACLIFSPAYRGPVVIRCTSNGGRSFEPATVPSAPHSPTAPAPALLVQGVSFVDSLRGHLLIEDDDLGTRYKPKAEPLIWSTDDGGRSWHATYLGPVRPVPQYSP
jgi:photosystem II stability/assembly factor-like uncharacterized protein